MKYQKEIIFLLFFSLFGLYQNFQVNAQSFEDYRTLRIWDIENERWIEGTDYFSSVLDFEVVGDRIVALTKEEPEQSLHFKITNVPTRGFRIIVDTYSLVVFQIDDNIIRKEKFIQEKYASIGLGNNEELLMDANTYSPSIFNSKTYSYSKYLDKIDVSKNLKKYPDNGYSFEYKYDSIKILKNEKITSHYFPDGIQDYQWTENGALIGLKSSETSDEPLFTFVLYDITNSKTIANKVLDVDYVLNFKYIDKGRLLVLTQNEALIECTLYDANNNFSTITSYTIPEDEYFSKIEVLDDHSFSIVGYKKALFYSLNSIEPLSTINLPTLKGKNKISGIRYLPGKKWLLISQKFEVRGDLHLASIGYFAGDDEPEKDAKTFIKEFTPYKRSFYENIFIYELFGNDVTKNKIDDLFNNLKEKLTGDDDFNLFFSGGAYFIGDSIENYTLMTNDLPDSISDYRRCTMCLKGSELIDIIKPILDTSNENFLIFDLDGSEVIYENLTASRGTSTKLLDTRGVGVGVDPITNRNYFIGIKKENTLFVNNSENGYTLSYLLAALAGAADLPCPGDGLVTTAELGAFLYLNSSNQYPVFAAGDQLDISLVKENEYVDLDLQKPVITWIDNGPDTTEDKSIRLSFQLSDNVGIHELKVNNKERKLTKDNKYSILDIPLKVGSNEVVIHVTDVSKNKTSDTLSVLRTIPKIGPVNHALFIATNEYTGKIDEETHWTNLQNPIRDAEAIASELASNYDFDTTIVRNATYEEIENAIKKTKNKIYKETDQLFIFIAGHGYIIDSQGCLVAKDSYGKSSIRNYISYDNLKAWLKNEHPSKHILLTLDVCGGGTFFDNIASSTRRSGTRGSTVVTTTDHQFQSELREIDNILKRFTTRMTLTSSDERDVFDGKEHSPFAFQFLRILRETKKGSIIDANALYQAVKQQKSSRPILDDFEGGEAGSTFYFIRRR